MSLKPDKTEVEELALSTAGMGKLWPGVHMWPLACKLFLPAKLGELVLTVSKSYNSCISSTVPVFLGSFQLKAKWVPAWFKVVLERFWVVLECLSVVVVGSGWFWVVAEGFWVVLECLSVVVVGSGWL